MKESKSW